MKIDEQTRAAMMTCALCKTLVAVELVHRCPYEIRSLRKTPEDPTMFTAIKMIFFNKEYAEERERYLRND